MIQLIDQRILVNPTHCQQCGACYAVCPKHAISFQLTDDGLEQINVDDSLCISCLKCMKVCPSRRANDFNKDNYFRPLNKNKYFLASNKDNLIRSLSSSGGAIKTIVINSLKQGLVDGVYTLRALNEYPSAVGEFYTATNIPDYKDMPNSVYHSIMACKELGKVKKVNRLMIVGTSCQLYAIEKALKGKFQQLIKICIFCKQQKTLDSTRWMAKVSGRKLPDDLKFSPRYRGEGWPGTVKVASNKLLWENAAGLPFGRRLWTVPGCNICGDPFGLEVNVDLTAMDPWTIREPNDLGETLITCHTEVGRELLLSMTDLQVEAKTFEEIRPALGLEDIWRKRACVPWFLGESTDELTAKAAEAEMKQRKQIEGLLNKLPYLPFIFYRVLNRLIPKKRDALLKPDLKI